MRVRGAGKSELANGYKFLLSASFVTIWDFNLRHLRAAVETARLGSINSAADAVSLTQPAVTQAIARLEGLLGVALFERRHDGVMPTDAARLFLPRADAAHAHIASPRVTMAQLRALIALAAAGSYASASAATGLAQPSLHRAVNDLSVALKRSLVERRGKGLMLTEVGWRTVRAFRLARAELEAGLSEVEGLKGRETGRISVGAMPLSRARVLPHSIAAFLQDYPDVSVRVLEGSWAELIEPLRDGEIDLMLGALRDPSPGDDVVQVPLFEDRPVVIARRGHPLEGTAPSLEALASFPWTVSAPGTPLRHQWERMFAPLGHLPAVPVECGSVITIRELLLGGDMLTLLSPDQVRVELVGGWLTRLCDAPDGLSRMIGVTTRTGWRPTARQRAFLAALEQVATHRVPENL